MVVRRTDRALMDPLRRNERELVRRVNRAISDAINEGVIPSPITVSTGLVLPSGDVQLRCDRIEDVRTLTAAAQGEPSWCHVFGESSHLKRTTFPVVMFGVPTTFDPRAPDAKPKL